MPDSAPGRLAVGPGSRLDTRLTGIGSEVLIGQEASPEPGAGLEFLSSSHMRGYHNHNHVSTSASQREHNQLARVTLPA